MSFLESVPEASAEGDVAEMYQFDQGRLGYIPNYTRTFSIHPEAYHAWRRLISSIAKPMEERRYELVTVAAAGRLRSSYCMLAHGKILKDKFFDVGAVQQLVEDPALAPLDEVDRAVIDLAAKVVVDAGSVTQEDVDELRALGLGDREILDVILAAAARSFFSKVLDATGTLPDHAFNDLAPALREALTVGRPIDAGAAP